MAQQLSAKFVIAMFAGLVAVGMAKAEVDVEAAKALAKANDCLKCHGTDKDKKGPAMSKISDQYKGTPDGRAKAIKHMTSGPTVKLSDGLEVRHRIIDTKDPKELENIAGWFLSH